MYPHFFVSLLPLNKSVKYIHPKEKRKKKEACQSSNAMGKALRKLSPSTLTILKKESFKVRPKPNPLGFGLLSLETNGSILFAR
jgi:hypothetical protein